MKTHLLKLLAIAAVLPVLGLLSCGDDAPPGKTPLLVNKSWSIVSYEIGGEDVLEDCQRDNLIIFSSDGYYTSYIGEILCEEEEIDTGGTWIFKANETILSFRPFNDADQDWTIRELTETSLIIANYFPALGKELVLVMTAN